MKENLKGNKIEHKIEVTIDFDELKEFIEEKAQVKIEGKITNISTYIYARSDREIEFTITATKEDRLHELTYDAEE